MRRIKEHSKLTLHRQTNKLGLTLNILGKKERRISSKKSIHAGEDQLVKRKLKEAAYIATIPKYYHFKYKSEVKEKYNIN